MKLSLQSILSGLASISKLNANFTAIASEFQDKVLYRDNPAGEPNQMECGLDMNENDVLNVGNIQANSAVLQSLELAGSPIVLADLVVLASAEEYTPEDAGAVGDGTTDDTTALQAAIDYCKATGRILQLGNRQYRATELTITISATDKGPLIIRGHGAPQNFSNNLGSQIRQVDGTTGSLFTIQGDFIAADYLTGVVFEDLGLQTSSACTGWAIDARNMTNNANGIRRVAIYTPGSSCKGAIRMNSCWAVSIEDVTCTGPAAGTTSRGIVIFGSANSGGSTRGTCNQIVLKNVRANYYAKCNVQFGKWDSDDNVGEGTGGFMQGILWLGGQAGSSSAGYGVVFARCLDVRVHTVHTENNYKSGWLFDDDPSGTDCGDIELHGCDSFNDGDDGAYADAADRYGIQVNRGTLIKVSGFRFQKARYGIYVADSTETDQVILDRIRFAAHTSGGTTALKLANTSASTSKRVRLGDVRFGGTWTNRIVNGEVLSSMSAITGGDVSTSSGVLSVDPEQEVILVADGSTATINEIASSTDDRTFPDGKTFKLVFTTGNSTLADVSSGGSATFKLENGKNFTPATGDSVTVCYRSGEWWEVGRKYRDATVHSEKTHTSGTTVEVTNLTRKVILDVASATTITDLTGAANKGPVEGQRILVVFADTNSTLEDNNSNASAKFYLEQNRNFNGNTQDTMELVYQSGYWYEVFRKYNGNPLTHKYKSHTSGGTIEVTNLTDTIWIDLGANTNITDLTAATGRAPYTTQRITIKNVDAVYTPTFKDKSGGAGNHFILASDADLALGYTDTLVVEYDGTDWVRVGGSNN